MLYALLWSGALALVVGVVFFTRGPQTEPGGIPFECGGRSDRALLAADAQVFELHRTPEEPSSGTRET